MADVDDPTVRIEGRIEPGSVVVLRAGFDREALTNAVTVLAEAAGHTRFAVVHFLPDDTWADARVVSPEEDLAVVVREVLARAVFVTSGGAT